MTSAQQRIADLKAEIETLQQSALKELKEKRASLAEQLAEVEAQIADMTGQRPEPRRRGPKARSSEPARSLPLQELKDLLGKAPDKTLNVRREGLDLRNIKVLAAANPQLLRLGGKGPWPTVTLLK